MKKNRTSILIICLLTFFGSALHAQENSPGFKTTLVIKFDEVGTALCEVTNKYTASYWDYFTKTVGSNTSIINNQLKKVFPKYHLSDFNHSQDANARSNSVKFKIDGMININKNGKWEADLERKDPDITKVSDKEYLITEEGQSIRLHLPAGTTDSKIEKNSFGKAVLTYSASTGGGMGKIMLYLGIAVAVAGIVLLVRNMKGAKAKPAPVNSPHNPLPQEKNQNPAYIEVNRN